jgi:hypothetical protein
LTTSLRDESTVSRAKACLHRFCFLSNSLNKASSAIHIDTNKVNTRVFLASYMIACHPASVFDSMGPLETALLESARRLLVAFEAIVYALHADDRPRFASLPAELLQGFPAALADYQRRFQEWKVPDEARLVCRIQHALLSLHQARALLPAAEPAGSPLRAEFASQIGRLREKLRAIGGGAVAAQTDAALAAVGLDALAPSLPPPHTA